MARRPLSERARRQRRIALAILLLLVVAVVGVAAAAELREDDAPEQGEPYDAAMVADLETRAANGLSHVVYERSPGGVEATAKRVMAYRDRIEDAVGGTQIPPDLLEAIVFLESGGRPDVIAGRDQDPEAASGLTQIVASTATDFLQMRVDLAESRQLTRDIASARSRGDRREVNRLLAERRRVDDRFVPDKALRGAVRYLEEAQRQLGRLDLAITSYHMGIGNLSNAIRAYAGAGTDVAVPDLVRQYDLSYARLYFHTSPLSGAATWRTLTELQDDSSNYYWKVLACREILRLARTQPDRLAELAGLHGRGPSAARVLHPEGDTASGPAEPQTTTTLDWIQRVVGKIVPGEAPLEVLRTAGWTIDVRRKYASDEQATAFQYVLDRLAALDLVTWERMRDRIRITVSSEASALAPPAGAPQTGETTSTGETSTGETATTQE
jgi:hypothetical protein